VDDSITRDQPSKLRQTIPHSHRITAVSPNSLLLSLTRTPIEAKVYNNYDSDDLV